MEKTISVIIPVYNVENYLVQCLDSVINQTYRNIEIICIDDASTDNSYKILKEYAQKDNRIIVLQNPKNVGLGLTRNRGLELAKGDYIHFVDSDDWLELNLYEQLINKLSTLDTEPDLLFFEYKMIFEDENTVKDCKYPHKELLDKILSPSDVKTFENWDRYAWMKLHRHEYLKENNIKFNDYRCMEDMEYAALLYTTAKTICYTDIFGVYYRRRKDSLVSKRTENLDCIFNSFINNAKIYKNLPEEIKYKLLGYDYIHIFWVLPRAYYQNYISIFKAMYMLMLANRGQIDKYKFKNQYLKDNNQIVRLIPLFRQKHKKFLDKIFSVEEIREEIRVKKKKKPKVKKHKCITFLGIKLKIKHK